MLQRYIFVVRNIYKDYLTKCACSQVQAKSTALNLVMTRMTKTTCMKNIMDLNEMESKVLDIHSFFLKTPLS